MKPVLNWLVANRKELVRDLANLVAIPSISNDGEHQKEIDQSAALTCEQMRAAGLHEVEILQCGDSNPYAYGEWIGDPKKPTVFLYAHHDVQPLIFLDQWQSDAWTLTPRGGPLFGLGAADDEGNITAQLGDVQALPTTHGETHVNSKMSV